VEVQVPSLRYVKEVEVNPRDSALLIVDMQNDFVRKEGKLYVPKAEETIPSISKLLSEARSAEAQVFFTQDWHMKDDPEFKIWGEHALAGTWGAEIIEELSPNQGGMLVKKYRYDAFFESPLDYLLRVKGIKRLVVMGTVANICVLHTAASAALRWYDVILPRDTISAMTEFDYYATLRQVDFLYKGTLTSSEGVRWIKRT
jgi:Amidases related to nicotinamidase